MTRTAYLDPDFRHEPKTARFCYRCQKDIRPEAPARWVFLRNDGANVLHPEDVAAYRAPNDIGWVLIGPECARFLGEDWITVVCWNCKKPILYPLVEQRDNPLCLRCANVPLPRIGYTGRIRPSQT